MHYHLIGIGGIGMSGIARLFLASGAKVSGSDLKASLETEKLAKSGAIIFIGHNAANIFGADFVVYSSAIKDNNPEIIEAKIRGVPLLRRAEALAKLMENKSVVAVSGSHGKTTTTSLSACLLSEAGLSPTVAVGGIVLNLETNAAMGGGDFFVAEADESDGSFLCYNPKYSIITNIDREHLDYYGDFESEVAAFGEFLRKTNPQGCVFACSDDNNLRGILKDYKNKYVLFGLGADADIYPKNIELKGFKSEFDCIYKNKLIGRFSLSLAGEHNISNALSVIALGLELGISVEVIKKALFGFKGSKRRLEVKFSNKDYLVVDDYAHHPSEIKATLKAASGIKHKRIVVAFQPHRYSRTKLLLDDFTLSFDAADYIIITDIYAASEEPIEGVNAQLICQKIRERCPEKEVVYLAKEEIVQHILGIKKVGDLILTLGAGDITKLSDELARRLKELY